MYAINITEIKEKKIIEKLLFYKNRRKKHTMKSSHINICKNDSEHMQ